MLESARSMCDRPSRWMFSRIFSSVRGPAERRSRTRPSAAIGGCASRRGRASPCTPWSRARRISGPTRPTQALRLVPGDIVLVRESTRHQMAHAPGAACIPFADLPLDPTGRRRVVAGDGPATVFFCGAYDFEGDLCRSTLDSLPATFRLRPSRQHAARDDGPARARDAARRARPAGAARPPARRRAGAGAARALHGERRHAPAWFRASGDPHVGAALRALHADPARQWTVADLAAAAALSRSAFARRFTELLGEAPLAYLTQWRMALARERLRDTDQRSPRSRSRSATARSSPSRRRSSATTAPRPAAGGRAPAGRVARAVR